MARFRLVRGGVIDTENARFVPDAPGNRHWREYQEWLAEGNTPDPAEPEFEPPPKPVIDKLPASPGLADVTARVDALIDVLKARGVIG